MAGWMHDGWERWQERGQGGGEEKTQKRIESQMAEKMVSVSDQQGSSELGPRTCGRPGIRVKTEEEEVGGLGRLKDFLKAPVTSRPPQICSGAFYRHPEASEPDLIQLLISVELFIEETQTQEAFKSAPPSIPFWSASCLNQTQVSMVMFKQTQRDCCREGVTAGGKAAGHVRGRDGGRKPPSDTSQAPRVAHTRSLVILTSKLQGLRRQTQGTDEARGGGWEPQRRKGAEPDGNQICLGAPTTRPRTPAVSHRAAHHRLRLSETRPALPAHKERDLPPV